jgi:uracil-DNA glycosylase family 4
MLQRPSLSPDPGCTRCSLHKQAQHVCLLGVGPIPCPVFILGQNPGREEDAAGIPFIGQAGQVLDALLQHAQLNRDEVFITNAVACHSKDNKKPSPAQVRECRYWLQHQLDLVRPKFILLLGSTALESYLHITSGIRNKRGRLIAQEDGTLVLPTFHPAAALYDPNLLAAIEADFRYFGETVRFGAKPRETRLRLHIVDSRAAFEEMLPSLHGIVSFDIETTDLYPWSPNAQIICLGFGTEDGEFHIPISHPQSPFSPQQIRGMIARITPLLNDCVTVTHNGKFDALWIKKFFHIHWRNDFDTILAHYLLNENDLHDLEHVSRQLFAAPAWDIPLKDKQGGASIPELAEYHAHDLYYTRRAYFELNQKLKQDGKLRRVFHQILMPCANLFVEMEYNGVYIDTSKMADAETYLREQLIFDANDKPISSKSLQKRIDINWASPQQVADYLYTTLKIKPPIFTDKGNPSTAEAALKLLNHPCVSDLLRFRELKQQLSLFIKGWAPYLKNNRLHPSFKLHGTITGRISSEHPNCLDGNCLITIPGGRKPLKDIKAGDWVYCYDKRRKLALSKVSWAGKTGTKKVLEITWHSSKKFGRLRLTKEHKVLLSSGRYIEAGKLRRGDTVVSLSHRYTDKDNRYPELRIFGFNGTGIHHGWVDEHRVVFKLVNEWSPEHVHHRNGNRADNNPSNLEGLSQSEHQSISMKGAEGSRRARLAHARHGSKIIEATIRARKIRSERELPTAKVREAWRRFGNRKGSVHLASKWLGFSRKTVERRWTLLGLASYHIQNNHRVLSVEPITEPIDVYDLTVDKHHNFIANEVCVHNCQQVPTDTRIRSLITAPRKLNYELLEADLSQIELRLVAELSGEPNMRAAFAAGIDIHWYTTLREIEEGLGHRDLILSTARHINNGKSLPYGDAVALLLKNRKAATNFNPLWKKLRDNGKHLNFGLTYMMTWRRFIVYMRTEYDIHINEKEAKRRHAAFFRLYNLKKWHERMASFAFLNGYVRSLTGRLRRLPQAQLRYDCAERSEAQRQAINSPIQSLASDINNMVLLQISREYPDRRIFSPVATIHDAILAEVYAPYIPEIGQRLLEIMRRPALFDDFNIDLSVPLEGEVKIGNWGSGIPLDEWIAQHD